MSYILDALKRADAERERGSVPGLHTRPIPAPGPGTAHAPKRMVLALATASILGSVAVAFWFWRAPATDPQPVAAQPAPANAESTETLARATPTPSTPPSKPMKTGVPRSPATTAPPRPANAIAAAPASLPVTNVSEPVTPPIKADSGATAMAGPAPLAVAQAAPIASAPASIPLLSELSQELRRQIAPLAITGVVYSANPAQRLLLINNQVLNQGSLAAPDVSLEEIRAQSSVFSFRGTRFRLLH